jgi:tripartite-type tricarboxylate transporter receptor subunit TctC
VLIIEALKKTPIKFRENFEPLLRVQSDLQLIGVAKNSKFKSFKEVIDHAKANPAKKLKIGGLSPGGLDDYIANGLSDAAGIDWTYVPYKSGSEIKAAVLGGELDIYQDKLISFLPLVESGDIRPLVVLNETRLTQVPALKDVPCTVEMGIKFTQGSWRGFCVKKGTPPAVKQVLIDALQKAYETPSYKEMEAKEMTNIRPGYAKADEFKAIWDNEYEGYVYIFKKMAILKK